MDLNALVTVQQSAASGALTAWAAVGNFVALIILALVLFLFCYRVGKGPFVSLVMALYVGYALYSVFPYAHLIQRGVGTAPAYVAGVSLVLYAIAVIIPYLIIRKVSASDFINLSTTAQLILSVLTAGFLLALAHHALSLGGLYAYPEPLASFFDPAYLFFWWFIAPLAGFLFFTGKSRRH
ncbi:MAG TPA: hypothetical protein VHC20_02600 [Candidatus Paceibacterota bacterium]|nr:hypothetical protein [Candidatus Paceibacterota bacterium]